jgi:hypothetical protein
MSRSTVNRTGGDEEGGPADTTAEDLFAELSEEAEEFTSSAAGDEIYEELTDDESVDDIIAAADEAAEEHPVDDAILPDEDALDDLLLSERTESDGFLWVDTGSPESADEDADVDLDEDWSEAFAQASEATLDDAGEADESTDEPEINIDVPDPDEVEGARPDADTNDDADASDTVGRTAADVFASAGSEADSPATDATEATDASDGPDAADAAEGTDAAATDGDDFGTTVDATFDHLPERDDAPDAGADTGEDADDGEYIFDVDEETKATDPRFDTDDEDTAVDATDDDADRGLLARLKSLLLAPF